MCEKIEKWQVELKQNQIYYEKNSALELPSRKSFVIKRNENIKKMKSYLFRPFN